MVPIETWELTMTGRHRVSFKKLMDGSMYVEFLRPGELRDGHGWVVIDSLFVEESQLNQLRKLLGAETTLAKAPLAGDLMDRVTPKRLKMMPMKEK